MLNKRSLSKLKSTFYPDLKRRNGDHEKFRLTHFHKIGIFPSRIHSVAVQIVLRFYGKSLGQKEKFREYRQSQGYGFDLRVAINEIFKPVIPNYRCLAQYKLAGRSGNPFLNSFFLKSSAGHFALMV
jgi:hypothetical protein